MKSRLAVVVAMGFFMANGFVMPAYAESTRREPTQAEKDTARAYLKEARELFAAKEYARAAGLYEKAHDIMHAPITAIELMETYAFLEKNVEAWAIGDEIQAYPPKPGEPEPFVKAREKIAEAMLGLASRISVLVLQFKSERPPGIRVTIDGKTLTNEQLDKPYRVNQGDHVIVCEAPDFALKRITQTVLSKTADEYVIPIEMDPLAPPPVDKKPDHTAHETSRNTETTAPMPLWVPWVGFGATAGASILLGAGAGATYSSMEEVWNNPQYSSLREKQFDGDKRTLQGLSISSVAVGAVSLGALGFALYQTFRPQKTPSRAQIVWSAKGLSVVGVW